MALLRVVHAAELPDPAALMARLQGGEGAATIGGAPMRVAPASAASPAHAHGPATFGELVKLLEAKGRALLAQQLHDQVGLVCFSVGELDIKPLRPLGTNFPRELGDALRQLTGSAWKVTLSDGEAQPSLLQQEQMAEERARAAVLADPNVAAVLSAFPGATLESVSTKGASHAQLR